MDIEFDVKMTPGILFDFKMQYSYRQPITILATAAGGVLCYLFISGMQTNLIYLIIGILLILYTPVNNLYSSFVQVKLIPSFQEPLHYRLAEEGIEVSQGEEKQVLPWDNVTKAYSNKKSIFVHSSKKAAFIFPRKSLGNFETEAIQTIAAHISPDIMKIRY